MDLYMYLMFLYRCLYVYVYIGIYMCICMCICGCICVCKCICVCACMLVKCGSMPIRAIAVYVPKEESRLSLSVRRKKIDTRKPIASRHYTNLHLHLEYTYYLIYNKQCIYIVYII